MPALCGKAFVVRAGLLAVCLSPAGASLAQQPAAPAATTRYQVTVVRIKPDMITEWIDLQKNEVIPALKKGGVKERTVLQTAIGNSFEYTVLTPYPSFAALDSPPVQVQVLGAEAAARLASKVRKCVDVQRNYLINRVNDLAIPQGDAVASRTIVLRPPQGKIQDYLAYLRADVQPVMKKAKAAGQDRRVSGVDERGRGGLWRDDDYHLLHQVRRPGHGQSHLPSAGRIGRSADHRQGYGHGDDRTGDRQAASRGLELLRHLGSRPGTARHAGSLTGRGVQAHLHDPSDSGA